MCVFRPSIRSQCEPIATGHIFHKSTRLILLQILQMISWFLHNSLILRSLLPLSHMADGMRSGFYPSFNYLRPYRSVLQDLGLASSGTMPLSHLFFNSKIQKKTVIATPMTIPVSSERISIIFLLSIRTEPIIRFQRNSICLTAFSVSFELFKF